MQGRFFYAFPTETKDFIRLFKNRVTHPDGNYSNLISS